MRYLLSIAIACAVVLPAFAQEPNPALVERVKAALPEKPTVSPKADRKMLVFTLCKGFKHSSIPLAAQAMTLLGEKTGAFKAVVSDDPKVFAPESLKGFDAVCFDNTTGTLFDDPAMKAGLLEFVRSGKGIVGIHAATDCFYDWPEFGALMGGYFDGHPWGADQSVVVKLDDPAHPLCQAFGGSGFSIKDEIYQMKEPYSREQLRELLSIDTSKSDMTRKGIKREDGDFAISWIRAYGQGRVFYCSLGHNEEVFATPAVMRHYLDGIQYALGDLAADAAPTAKLTPKQIAESQQAGGEIRKKANASLLNDMWPGLVHYEYGQDQKPYDQLAWMVDRAHIDDQLRAELSARVAALVAGTDATASAKDLAAKALARIGDESIAPVLADQFTDRAKADVARAALEKIPGKGVDRVLIKALSTAPTTDVAVGLINTLGQRRAVSAIAPLRRYAAGKDAPTRDAALLALGKIGNDKAGDVLESLHKKACGDVVDDALLLCASRLGADGNEKEAAEYYTSLTADTEASRVRAAALSGLAACSSTDAVLPLLRKAAEDKDEVVRGAALCAMRGLPGPQVTAAFVEMLPAVPVDVQPAVLSALGGRTGVGPDVEPAILKAAASEDETVRIAALEALAAQGTAACLPLLADTANGVTPVAKAAKATLDVLYWKGVDADMLTEIQKAPAQRLELIRAIGRRRQVQHAVMLGGSVVAPGDGKAVDVVCGLLDLAAHQDATVRSESFQALKSLVSVDDLPKLLELLAKETSPDVQEKAEAATAAAVKTLPEQGIKAIADAFDKSPVQAALVRVLARVGDPAVVPVLQRYEKTKGLEKEVTAALEKAQPKK